MPHTPPRPRISPAVIVGGMLAIIGAAGVGGYWVWKESRPAEVAVDTRGADSRPVGAKPEPTARKLPTPKPKPVPKVEPAETPMPVEKRPLTFDEAYAEAVKTSANLDANEPEQTRKTKRLFTNLELNDIEFEMGDAANQLESEGAARLARKGFGPWVERWSRQFARNDKVFIPFARVVWEPETGASGVLSMMNAWVYVDSSDRIAAAKAVADNLRTSQMEESTRDAIIQLGGGRWLQRP